MLIRESRVSLEVGWWSLDRLRFVDVTFLKTFDFQSKFFTPQVTPSIVRCPPMSGWR